MTLNWLKKINKSKLVKHQAFSHVISQNATNFYEHYSDLEII